MKTCFRDWGSTVLSVHFASDLYDTPIILYWSIRKHFGFWQNLPPGRQILPQNFLRFWGSFWLWEPLEKFLNRLKTCSGYVNFSSGSGEYSALDVKNILFKKKYYPSPFPRSLDCGSLFCKNEAEMSYSNPPPKDQSLARLFLKARPVLMTGSRVPYGGERWFLRPKPTNEIFSFAYKKWNFFL